MITPYDREHVDDLMAGAGDWFSAQMLRLCQKADSGNLEKIRLGFPDVVSLYEWWYHGKGEKDA